MWLLVTSSTVAICPLLGKPHSQSGNLCEGPLCGRIHGRRASPDLQAEFLLLLNPSGDSGPGEATPALPAFLQAPGFDSLAEVGRVPGSGVVEGSCSQADGG